MLDFGGILIASSDNPLDFHYTIWLGLASTFKYLLISWNTGQFWVTSSSKWLWLLKQLKSNVFSFFNSSSTSKCFVLFVIFLLRLDSVASKSVFVIKFACANLALKTSAAEVLNSGVAIYLS